MRKKGERWELHDGRKVIITADLANGWVRVMNNEGKLEVLQENMLRYWLNKPDFREMKA